MDNLPLLKDIHLPDAHWIFPLGYGWLILLLIPVLIYFLYRLWLLIQSKSRKIYALNILKSLNGNDLYSAMKTSELLRRICLYKYKNATSLFNQEWVDFLNAHSRLKISGDTAKLLIYAPYMKDKKIFKPQDFVNLNKFAKAWIGENL